MKRWRTGAVVLAIMAVGGGIAVSALEEAVPPEEALLVPFPEETAALFFINLAELRYDPLLADLIRQHAGIRLPEGLEGFSLATGFDIRTDVDQLALGSTGGARMLAAARATYDPDKVTGYFRDNGIGTEWHGEDALYHPDPAQDWKVAFLDGWILLGDERSLRGMIDRTRYAVGTVMDASLVSGIESIEDGSQVWAAGAFDHSLVPDGVAPPLASDLIASLERGTYQMRFSETVTGRAVGEFATPEAAQRSSNLLQGFLTLGRIQASEDRELLELLGSIRIETLDSAVHLTFAVDPALLQKINESGLRIR